MGLFDRKETAPQAAQGGNADEQAIERYRYMLKTAPPETLEQAHEEAFARLSPEQRRMVLDQLRDETPERERGAPDADDPRSLARLATRAEVRQPGTLERVFGGMRGGMGGGMGMGGLMAGSFLSSMAGVFLGSVIAQQFMGNSDFGQEAAAGDAGGEDQADLSPTGEADSMDSGLDDGGGLDDFGGMDI